MPAKIALPRHHARLMLRLEAGAAGLDASSPSEAEILLKAFEIEVKKQTRQVAELAPPESFVPPPILTPCADGIGVALGAARAPARSVRQLRDAPERALAAAAYVQARTEPYSPGPQSVWPWLEHLRVDFFAALGLVAVDRQRVARQLGIDGIDALRECLARSCPLDRRARPWVRGDADATIVDAVLTAHPRVAHLHLAFVGCGGFFAELALVQRFCNVSDRPLTLTFVEHQMLPLTEVVHGRNIDDAQRANFTPALFAMHCATLQQAAGVLGATCGDTGARVYGSHADLLDATTRVPRRPCHAVICLDPSLFPAAVDGARFSAAAVAAFAGAADCVTAVLAARGFDGPRLRITQLPVEMRASLPPWPRFRDITLPHAPSAPGLNRRPLDAAAAQQFFLAAESKVILDRALG